MTRTPRRRATAANACGRAPVLMKHSTDPSLRDLLLPQGPPDGLHQPSADIGHVRALPEVSISLPKQAHDLRCTASLLHQRTLSSPRRGTRILPQDLDQDLGRGSVTTLHGEQPGGYVAVRGQFRRRDRQRGESPVCGGKLLSAKHQIGANHVSPSMSRRGRGFSRHGSIGSVCRGGAIILHPATPTWDRH